MFDKLVVSNKAEIIHDPFNIFLKLSEAKINISHFDRACEAMVYYFDNKVKWTDFLATSIIDQPQKYRKRIIIGLFCFCRSRSRSLV